MIFGILATYSFVVQGDIFGHIDKNKMVLKL